MPDSSNKSGSLCCADGGPCIEQIKNMTAFKTKFKGYKRQILLQNFVTLIFIITKMLQ